MYLLILVRSYVDVLLGWVSLYQAWRRLEAFSIYLRESEREQHDQARRENIYIYPWDRNAVEVIVIAASDLEPRQTYMYGCNRLWSIKAYSNHKTLGTEKRLSYIDSAPIWLCDLSHARFCLSAQLVTDMVWTSP